MKDEEIEVLLLDDQETVEHSKNKQNINQKNKSKKKKLIIGIGSSFGGVLAVLLFLFYDYNGYDHNES